MSEARGPWPSLPDNTRRKSPSTSSRASDRRTSSLVSSERARLSPLVAQGPMRATDQSCMQVSGNASAGLGYDVAVAKKVLQSTREQGQQALQLIQAASPAASSTGASGGRRLDVVA